MLANVQSLLGGFGNALTPGNILAMFIGSVLGMVVGALPGLGSLTGVALLLPLTYSLNPTAAIIMLCAIYYANMYGGAYSAILLNIPGDNSAVMTALDGYPLAKKGKAGKALFTANASSFVGGTIGMIILTFFAPALAALGLKFGPAEMTSLLLLALTSLGWMIGENPMKGLVSTVLGVLLATIGSDPTSGASRFTFGNYYLLGGISFVPLVIGVFGFSQLIELMAERHHKTEAVSKRISYQESMLSREEIGQIAGPTLRGGFLGCIVGILPGAGGSVANFLSYILEKRIGKRKEMLGTGILEGVAASESANNSCVAGALAPMFALGIPGSGTTAVLLAGLIMFGLTPGPLLFSQQGDFVWSVIASMYTSNVFCLAVGMLLIPFLTKISAVSSRVLIPVISVICLVGSYGSTNSAYGVVIMLIGGFFGFILKKGGYPAAPMLLAFVLCPMLEKYMRRALISSFGNPAIFITRPISLAFLLVLFATTILPIVWKALQVKKASSKPM